MTLRTVREFVHDLRILRMDECPSGADLGARFDRLLTLRQDRVTTRAVGENLLALLIDHLVVVAAEAAR